MSHSLPCTQHPAFPRYAKYKDSGVEWLGEIPEHWGISKTRWLWDEIDDRSENGDEQLLSISQYTGVTPTISDSRSESLEGYRRCKPDDLAMNIMLAWQGGLGVSDYEGIVSPAYSVFRLKSDNNAHYLGYLYRTKRYLDEFGRNSTGIVPSRWRLYPDKFGHILTLLPPKTEQDRIVTFLDRKTAEIDALIAKKQRQIELLDEQKAILINRAVTRGLNPNAKLKPSGIEWIGDIPEHWEVKKLKYLIDIQAGYAFKSSVYSTDESDIRLLRGINVNPGQINWGDSVYWPREKTRGVEEFSLEADNMVMGMDRPWVSSGVRVARVRQSDLPALLLQRVARIRAVDIEPDFLERTLTGAGFKAYFEPILTGVSVPHISPDQIASYVAAVPSRDEQVAICDFITKAELLRNKTVKSEEAQIESLKTLRSTLIAHAVTGTIKV